MAISFLQNPDGKKTYLVWAGIAVVFVVVGVVFLRGLSDIFIREAIFDVPYEAEPVAPMPDAAVGHPAPHWKLSFLGGGEKQLSEFFGAPAVILFWATWNSASVDQLKIFDDYVSKHPESFFHIVAINSQEDRSIVSNFVRRGGYDSVNIVLDETGAVGEEYRVRNLPTTYVLDSHGIVHERMVGSLDETLLLQKIEAVIRR